MRSLSMRSINYVIRPHAFTSHAKLKKSNLFQKQSFKNIQNAFSFILISLLVVKIFKSLYLFFPCCPLLKQVMENIFSKSYIFDVMSWFNFTKKYILLNILGRKNIQVLKLDILEECYKKEYFCQKICRKYGN